MALVFRQIDHNGWIGNLLYKALMRTRPIGELTLLTHDAPHVFVTQNQDVVTTLTPDAADESLANSICFGSIERRVDQVDARSFDRMPRTRPIICPLKVTHAVSSPRVSVFLSNT